jgi:monoamine oxidase
MKLHIHQEEWMAGHMEGAIASAERAARQTIELLTSTGTVGGS